MTNVELNDFESHKQSLLVGSRASMTPDRCPFRVNVDANRDGEEATCNLLRELTGLVDASLCRVKSDACNRCCRADRPALSHVTPVVASLLHRITDTVIDAQGMPGCDMEKAIQLREVAETNLAVTGATNDATDRPAPYSAGPFHDSTAIARLIPSPGASATSLQFRNWSVGITTSPRRMPTLDGCIDSLAAAGWDQPWLFVDGGTALADRHCHLPMTFRESKSGAWPNFLLALQELMLRAPYSDAFLLVQDDALFANAAVREYLETIPWPSDAGFISLYCAREYTQTEPGWSALDRNWVWGAVALIFPAARAAEFVRDEQVQRHRVDVNCTRPHEQRRVHYGAANVDVTVGEWAARHHWKAYFPTPSLVQHIGDASTIWQAAQAAGKRCASHFFGDT